MDILDFIYGWVWGSPLLILLMGLGGYLTVTLRGLQFRYLPYALKLAFTPQKANEGKGDISHFASLMTALAATIGIGNIAGVATAITVGGYGALFWMWVTALITMVIKYAEAILAVKYRVTDKKGEMCGGPMYFIEHGLGWKWLAGAFALFGAIAAFGGGNMLQANSVASAVHVLSDTSPWITGSILALCTGLTVLWGIRSISAVASYLVPFMTLFYLTGAGIILVQYWSSIPHAFWVILSNAFSGQAAFGGFVGSSLLLALRVGVSRGLMTSEAGLGTSAIAAAAAKTDLPGRQALVSMTGSFIATMVMCTITGLVLIVTGLHGTLSPEGTVLTGAPMTMAAFDSALPGGAIVVTLGLIFFAFTTLIGYAYYGEKCIEYLLGTRAVIPYRILFTAMVIPGAILQLDVVWKISDICNGMMAFPNLIAIFALSGVVLAETRQFLAVVSREKRQEELQKAL